MLQKLLFHDKNTKFQKRVDSKKCNKKRKKLAWYEKSRRENLSLESMKTKFFYSKKNMRCNKIFFVNRFWGRQKWKLKKEMYKNRGSEWMWEGGTRMGEGKERKKGMRKCCLSACKFYFLRDLEKTCPSKSPTISLL